jgi:flagellar biosynthesis GTPase FlhF
MPITQKAAAGSLAAAGAAVLAFAFISGPADADEAQVRSLSTEQTAWGLPEAGIPDQRAGLETQQGTAIRLHAAEVKAAEKAAAAKKTAAVAKARAAKAAAEQAAAKKAAAEKAAAKKAAAKQAAAEKAAKKKAAAKRAAAERAASRSAERSAPAAKTYTNDLDGWITEALDIMAKHGIPGSYEGLHRNIMRESSGNPKAINNWDINAQNGVPSKGLLQVIQPTFDAYHVPGTPNDLYDPVANIVAAANYAADRYGSIDNVDGPY